MNKMIQIRNVPAELHRSLKSRAAKLGLSLSDYALGELSRSVQKPDINELLDQIRSQEPVRAKISFAQIIREERDKR